MKKDKLCIYLVAVLLTLIIFPSLSASGSFFDSVTVQKVKETNVNCTEYNVTQAVSENANPDTTVTSTDFMGEYTTLVGETQAEASNKTENSLDNNIKNEGYAENLSEQSTKAATENVVPEQASDIEIKNFTAARYDSNLSETYVENISDLSFLSSNVGSLATSNSANIYKFTLDKRCMLTYTVIHDKLNALEGWRVELYEEYFVNGKDGEVGYRLLNVLKTDADSTKDTSVELGLGIGTYRLVVKSGTKYTSEAYKIDVERKYGSDYEIECNDNIYRYTEIYSDVEIKGSASYFDDKQDEDWYFLRVYEDGAVKLSFAHEAVKDKLTVCWQVMLYSESDYLGNGKPLSSMDSRFSDETLTSGEIGLSAGNYYILVRNRVYTDKTYTLNVARIESSQYEQEPNDTFAQANKIELNSVITGSVATKIDGTDKDYYVFTVTQSGYAMLEFSHTAISDSSDKDGWNIVLYNENGVVLFKIVSAWSVDVTACMPIGLAAGKYYVGIDSDNLYHNSENYFLSVSFTQSDIWESEYNGSMNSADPLSANQPLNATLSEMGTDFDCDWFTFTLTNDANVSVALSHEALTSSKNIFTFTLYDSTGTAVKNSSGGTAVNSSASLENAVADYTSLSAGKYYIKVTSGLFYENIIYSIKYSLS